MYGFTSLYSAASNVSIAAGFCFPGRHRLKQSCIFPVVLVYSLMTTVPPTHVIICNLILYYRLGVYDLRTHGLNTNVIVIFFNTFYYIFRENEINSLLNNFDNITENIINGKLIQNDYVNYVLNISKRFHSFTKYSFLVIAIPIFCNAVYFFGVHFLFSQDILFIHVPYNATSEHLFLLTSFLHMTS